MPIALEITLIVVLAALAVGLVPLLFQLRRTAQSIEVFLLSSTKDLAQIAEDVHASTLRLDHLVGSFQSSADELAVFTGLIGDVGRTVKKVKENFHNTLEMASRNLGGIVGGISVVLAFLKRRQTAHAPE